MREAAGAQSQRVTQLEQGALVLVLAGSLILRLSGLGSYITIDEPNWLGRSTDFREALLGRDWGATYQSEHPGVVTMWVGVLATHISDLADALVSRQGDDPTSLRPGGETGGEGVPQATLWARRIVAGVSWLGILLTFLILRHTVGGRVAWVATAFIALDPFFLTHSRLHHLDGLLTTFVMLSAASLLAYLRAGLSRRYLLISAVAAGLAVANKSPGLLLLPWAAVALGIGEWRASTGPLRNRLARCLSTVILWEIVAIAIVLAIWPALWVAPKYTLERVLAGGLAQGLSPHENLNFFWFKIRADPGPAFYPVAWAFRTTPWVVAGLAALGIRAQRQGPRGVPVTLVGLVLAYAVLMTLAAKKFDRYLLPVFPLIDMLAALGYASLFDMSTRLPGQWGQAARAGLLSLLTVGQLALIWPTRPYYSAYFNPLVGGTRTAPHVLLVGWGEGLEKAAAYLNGKPDAEKREVAIQSFNDFKPFFVGEVSLAGYAPLLEPDYFILYSSHVQRNFVPQVVARLYGVEVPEYVARVNGLEYAWVYPNTIYRQEALALLEQIESRGEPEREVVVLNVNAALQRSYRGLLSLVAIAGPARDDFILTELQRAATGHDRMWFLTFPESDTDALPEADGETRRLLNGFLAAQSRIVEQITVNGVQATGYMPRVGARFVPVDSAVRRDLKLGEHVRLLGYDLPETELVGGESLFVRLYWQADGLIEVSYKVFTHLLGPDGNLYGQLDAVPQGYARPTTSWRAGETILDDYRIEVPAGAPTGEYVLAFGMYDPQTMMRVPVIDAAGQELPEARIAIDGLHLSPDGQR